MKLIEVKTELTGLELISKFETIPLIEFHFLTFF